MGHVTGIDWETCVVRSITRDSKNFHGVGYFLEFFLFRESMYIILYLIFYLGKRYKIFFI